MSKWANLFLFQSMIGRGIDLNDSEAIIKKAVRLAYNDMLSAGMYYLYYKDNKKEGIMDIWCDALEGVLKRECKFSKEMIESVIEIIYGDRDVENEKKEKICGKEKQFATRYGLMQKIVNMSFKYLFVCSNFLDPEKIQFDFKQCDCPIDRVIIKKLIKYKTLDDYKGIIELKDITEKKYVWSKLTKKKYENCQQAICKILSKKYKELKKEFKTQNNTEGQKMIDELKELGNLAFDFIEWGDISKLSLVMAKLD